MYEFTYQDLVNVGIDDSSKMKFCLEAINQHKACKEYKEAVIAQKYDKQQNVTITEYRKLLYTLTGEAVPDQYSANHKCASNFFHRFVVLQNQYLLGNGASFTDDKVKDALGGDKFDKVLKKAGREALIAGVSFGFFNMGDIKIFKLTEFVPLVDEEDGGLKAGIRFWQVNKYKPLRFTLYELDGYTEYIMKDGKEGSVLNAKRPYIQTVSYEGSSTEGEIIEGKNYHSFPIVPLWANDNHQSMLIGMRENIDCYDLIKSGFANDLDDASLIYWTLENAGGMDDIDLVKFVERMKTVKAAVVNGDSGSRAEAHTIDVPYQSRETYLTRLEADLYRDAMALNVNTITGGNITATAINAAYDPQDGNANEYEERVIEFIDALLLLAGYDEQQEYTFQRSRIANQTEETNMILSAAQYLDHETILRHLPFLSADEIEGILERTLQEETERFQQEKELAKEQAEEEETEEENNEQNTGLQNR